jgi:hypothetical protein
VRNVTKPPEKTEESPEASAEAMKERFAAADLEATKTSAETSVVAPLTAPPEKPTEPPSPIFRPGLDKEEFGKVKESVSARRQEQKPIDHELADAHSLIMILADVKHLDRTEFLSKVMHLLNGEWHSDFEAVREAVEDLYRRLVQVGR